MAGVGIRDDQVWASVAVHVGGHEVERTRTRRDGRRRSERPVAVVVEDRHAVLGWPSKAKVGGGEIRRAIDVEVRGRDRARLAEGRV